MYAFAIDGLDPEKRDEIDRIVNAGENGSSGDNKAKARRERAAVEAAMSNRA